MPPDQFEQRLLARLRSEIEVSRQNFINDLKAELADEKQKLIAQSVSKL